MPSTPSPPAPPTGPSAEPPNVQPPNAERLPPGRAGRLRRIASAALAVVLLGYGGTLAAVWWGQEGLIFHPAPLAPDHRFRLGPDVHEVFVDVPGARLNALHLRLPDPAGVVFYLHGNAGNLDSWFVEPTFYRRLNVDLYMLDYRGFGKSTGRIASEAELLEDVRTAWASIAPRYAGRRVVFIGRSLGTGLAAALAASLEPAARPDLLALVSPYRSLEALAGEHFAFVPSALVRYPLRTDRALASLDGGRPRILLLHGDRDTLIPLQHSEALLAASPRAVLARIAGAAHADVHAFPGYFDALGGAIAQETGAGRPAP